MTKPMLLTENDIKAELSYAYQHAVAARAGCAAVWTDRHTDGTGVDAVVRVRQRFAADSIYSNFSIDVQLKATSDDPACDERGRFPFPLRIDHYNKLWGHPKTTSKFPPVDVMTILVPMLRVGMPCLDAPRLLGVARPWRWPTSSGPRRDPERPRGERGTGHGSWPAARKRRRASRTAFPRGAWERGFKVLEPGKEFLDNPYATRRGSRR